ncbi:MAG: helix-turn-helix domain-containing protein, partial [Spirochaetaceae bacterium]|nr:helix-turn-helix domain-containing protein [Spirochaetaceae bacterium]
MPDETDPLLSAFGEQLREFRKKKGVSQENFAFDTGLDRTYISGLECGKRNPSLKIVFRLAKALGIEASELLKDVHQTG